MAAASGPRVRVKLHFDSSLLPEGIPQSYWYLLDTDRHHTVKCFATDIGERFAVAGPVQLTIDDSWLPAWESSLIIRENDAIRVRPSFSRKRLLSAGSEGDTPANVEHECRKKKKHKHDNVTVPDSAITEPRDILEIEAPPALAEPTVCISPEKRRKQKKTKRHKSSDLPAESTPLDVNAGTGVRVDPDSPAKATTSFDCCESSHFADGTLANEDQEAERTHGTLSASRLSAALTPAEERLLAEIYPDKKKRRRRPKKKLRDKLEQIASSALQNVRHGADVVVHCEYSGKRIRFPSGGDAAAASVPDVACAPDVASAPDVAPGIAVTKHESEIPAPACDAPRLAAPLPAVTDICYSEIAVSSLAGRKLADDKVTRIMRRSTAACLDYARCASDTAQSLNGADSLDAQTLAAVGRSSVDHGGSPGTPSGNTYYRKAAKNGRKTVSAEEMVCSNLPTLTAAKDSVEALKSSGKGATGNGEENMDTSVDYSLYQPLHDMPRVGDRIAYKIVELSENYTPHISSYKVGTVKALNQIKKLVDIELDALPDNKFEHGKFHLSIEDDNEILTNEPANGNRIVTESLKSLVDPKLLT